MTTVYTPSTVYSNRLLSWFEIHGRTLPWRAKPIDPYKVLVSEFMLQQTTVATVIPYFTRFMERFPTLHHLSKASLEEVYHLWQGLGYYTRAKNLLRTAQVVMTDWDGQLPSHSPDLIQLPGIGPYACAAIASIAFDEPIAVLDGNVRRVLARLFRLETTSLESMQHLRSLAQQLTPQKGAGDYAQAIMDLGALICRPKNPLCPQCPWQDLCAAHLHAEQTLYPTKKIKMEQPTREAFVFWLTDEQGRIWVRQRGEKGLLAHLWELPHTGFDSNTCRFDTALFPPHIQWAETGQTITHIFTHFKLTLNVMKGRLRQDAPPWPEGQWVLPHELNHLAFPTVMRKVLGLLKADASV